MVVNVVSCCERKTYIHNICNLSDIGEEIGVQWDSTLTIYRLKRASDSVRREIEKYCMAFSFNLVYP
jgi:hypothetical protein